MMSQKIEGEDLQQKIEAEKVDGSQQDLLEETETEKQKEDEVQRQKLINKRLREMSRSREEIDATNLIISTIIVFFATFFIYPFQICYCLFGLFYHSFIQPDFKQILFATCIITYCSSVIFMVIMTIEYFGTKEYQRLWYYDTMVFFVSTTLVVSFVKSVQDSYKIKHPMMIIHFLLRRGAVYANTLFLLSYDKFYSYDILDPHEYSDMLDRQFSRFMATSGLEEISVRFNYFKEEFKDFRLKNKASEWLVSPFEQKLDIRLGQAFILIFIVLIKTFLSVLYLYNKEDELGTAIIISAIATGLFYIFCTIVLLRTLGSYDLRRKTAMMEELNKKIDYRAECNEDELEDSELLDVTCPTSIESWDNARTFVVSHFAILTSWLELAYLGLFSYFVFIFAVAFSAYGEFYWIFSENSIYMQDLMVIQYSIDFVFIFTLLLIRLWEAQQFNESFSALDDNLNYLIDVIDDLYQMYDFHFIPKMQPLYLEDEDGQLLEKCQKSTYGIIVQHLTKKAETYIKRDASYQGQFYSEKDKDKLIRKMLKNSKNSLEKVKRQLELDERNNRYKFLGLFEIPFSEIFYTLLLALFSFLPNVIPKIVHMFKSD